MPARDKLLDRDTDRYRDNRDSRYRDSRKRDRDRDRDRDRNKRSYTPDRSRPRNTRSPDRRRSRSRSIDRYRNRRRRTPSPEQSEKCGDRKDSTVSDLVDKTAKEKKQEKEGGDDEVKIDVDEIEMMKMMGIPVDFDSTKGKRVEGNDISGVRVVTKRMPRQYMNRPYGFNRDLPAERNR